MATAGSFEWFVARRYLTARRKQAFISLISGVSVLGVGVGVMALVIATAVMTGVQTDLRDRVVGSTAHIYIYKLRGAFTPENLAAVDVPGVEASSPSVGDFVLASAAGEERPMYLKGVDPAREPSVVDIARAMRSGSWAALANRPPEASDGIVLGSDLASDLGVLVGDYIQVTTGKRYASPAGRVVGPPHTFEVVGILQFGFYEVDKAWGFVKLDVAKVLLPPKQDMLQLRLADLEQAPEIHRMLQSKLGPGFTVEDWTTLNGPLYAALSLEKRAIALTIGLIIFVAALNIVASLVLLVMEKSHDIAILKTMGARAGAIRRIFILQGVTIGVVGTTVGAVLGILVCYLFDHYRLITLPGDVYQISYLPFRVQAVDVLFIVASAIGVCFLATIYPSRQAGRLDPAEALRNQ